MAEDNSNENENENETEDPKALIKGLVKEAFTEFLEEYEPPKPKTQGRPKSVLENLFGLGS